MARRIDAIDIFKSLDWTTIVIYLMMVAFGVISIYAAAYDFDEASMFAFSEFSGKQVIWISCSLLLGFVILLTDARMFETYAYPIYALVLLLLFITPFIAPDIKGSHSWIVLGPMSLQPAEFAKFATALALAKLFAGYNFQLTANAGNFFKAVGIIIVPIVLILLQKETGSALTFLALFFVLYREGMSGLVLFAALYSVVIFVVAIKFTESAVMGIPVGEFWLLLSLIGIITAMMFIFNRRFEVARNVMLWFTITGVATWLCCSFGVDVPGWPVMLTIISVPCIYLGIVALRYHAYKLFVPVATALMAIVFMFSVNTAFGTLAPHQQQRIRVVLGMEEDLRGAGLSDFSGGIFYDYISGKIQSERWSIMEIWKPIKSNKNYIVSNTGRVRRVGSDRDHSTHYSKGYKVIDLYKNGERETRRVHRLVAEQFIPNPLNKPEGISSKKRLNSKTICGWYCKYFLLF